MCEDHFNPESFNSKSVRKALKRNAVPIPYNSRIAQDNPNKKNFNETECNRENTTGLSHCVEMNVESPISNDVTEDEQLVQEPPLKTYKPAQLCFDTPIEKDMMEWMYIEPSTSSNVKVSTVAGHNNIN